MQELIVNAIYRRNLGGNFPRFGMSWALFACWLAWGSSVSSSASGPTSGKDTSTLSALGPRTQWKEEVRWICNCIQDSISIYLLECCWSANIIHLLNIRLGQSIKFSNFKRIHHHELFAHFLSSQVVTHNLSAPAAFFWQYIYSAVRLKNT